MYLVYNIVQIYLLLNELKNKSSLINKIGVNKIRGNNISFILESILKGKNVKPNLSAEPNTQPERILSRGKLHK